MLARGAMARRRDGGRAWQEGGSGGARADGRVRRRCDAGPRAAGSVGGVGCGREHTPKRKSPGDERTHRHKQRNLPPERVVLLWQTGTPKTVAQYSENRSSWDASDGASIPPPYWTASTRMAAAPTAPNPPPPSPPPTPQRGRCAAALHPLPPPSGSPPRGRDQSHLLGRRRLGQRRHRHPAATPPPTALPRVASSARRGAHADKAAIALAPSLRGVRARWRMG